MNQEIMNKIQKEYEELVYLYGEDKILWVAAVGPSIFNHDLDSTIMVSACTLPNDNELYNDIPEFNLSLLDIRFISKNISNSTIVEMILSPYKVINPKYEEILNKELFLNKELLLLNNINKEEQLKKAIKNIIISAHNTSSQEEEFINKISKTELQVLKNIINDFNGNKEGYIVVSQATNNYNVSTVVFRTLFYKLKEYKIAEINSRGVKGTYVNFNNLNKIKSLIN